MNELIKFRAWNKRCLSMHEVIILTKDSVTCRPEKFLENPFVLGYKEFELMQFTGVKDGCGDDIYLGDILKFEETNYLYEVRFENGSYVCYHLYKDYGKWGNLSRIKDADFSEYKIYVVGNIYNNPELLTP
jgi:hypothetical protein